MAYRDLEKKRETQRRYREANHEKITERQRRWREANPEKQREYERRYSETKPERQRRWREANRERERERHRQYCEANREKVNAQKRRWRAANREQARSSKIRRDHGLWPEEWAALYEAQHGRCYLCGEEMAPADAVVDHDHSHCASKTSCRICQRGLAHGPCNSLIGLADDDPALLRRIADALEATQLKVERRKTSAAEQLALE